MSERGRRRDGRARGAKVIRESCARPGARLGNASARRRRRASSARGLGNRKTSFPETRQKKKKTRDRLLCKSDSLLTRVYRAMRRSRLGRRRGRRARRDAGGRRTPTAVHRWRYRAANLPEWSISVTSREGGRGGSDAVARARARGGRVGRLAMRKRSRAVRIARRCSEARVPSPRAFSFHVNELGFGSIQNLNMVFQAGSSRMSPW